MFYTHRFARPRPQIAIARRGGQSGKVTAVINVKLKEAMKIIKNAWNGGLVLVAREFFKNEFGQVESKPPNRMSDKAISKVDKYLKG